MSTNSFVAECPKCGGYTCVNNVSTRPAYHSQDCWSCGWFTTDQEGYEGEGYLTEEERLQFEQVMGCTQCYQHIAEVKQLHEEKEAMLKHITDLEAALKKAVEMWDEEMVVFDFELMITGVKEQFAHLFDLDDGYEPPEHMTADDFNEMHSGSYWPDDSGYMDGDE